VPEVWPWEPVTPHDVGRLLEELPAPWWIAGGWAMSLFLGRETRRHHDIDVALLRRDQAALWRHLSGWDLHYTTPERKLESWDGRFLEPPIGRIWARRSPGTPWYCEILLEEAADGRWLFRRDHRVSRPLAELGYTTPDALPFVSPEIALLYTLARPRPKAKADLLAVHSRMSPTSRDWLRKALGIYWPDHPALPLI
jgi:hypothetical protein